MAHNPKPIRNALSRPLSLFRKIQGSSRRAREAKRTMQKLGRGSFDGYILVGSNVVKVSLFYWSIWFQYTPTRVLRRTKLPGNVRVSTVFLGLDHSWNFGNASPILFETMIFGGEHDGYQDRYHTYNEALAGHKKAIALSFDLITPYHQ
jgi:hypothetical protein